MPIRCTNAIRTRIATTDHHNMLALGDQLIDDRVPCIDLVLQRQEFHRVMNALHFTSRHRQITRRFRPTGDHDSVELLAQLIGRNGFTR